jgi:hypothetical protein
MIVAFFIILSLIICAFALRTPYKYRNQSVPVEKPVTLSEKDLELQKIGHLETEAGEFRWGGWFFIVISPWALKNVPTQHGMYMHGSALGALCFFLLGLTLLIWSGRDLATARQQRVLLERRSNSGR